MTLLQTANIGHAHSQCSVKTGQRIAQTEVGSNRNLTGLAIDIAKATKALTDLGKAGVARIGTGLAIPGDAGVDQAGIYLFYFCRAQTPFFHLARTEVFN